MPYEFGSDVIAFKEIDTGGNSAGNGGNGYNEGEITNKPKINFEPSNKAEGADVDARTGDYVKQKAYWDAEANGGDASAKVKEAEEAEDILAKANGGEAESNGDQESESGHNRSEVDANTTATQDNELRVDQSQMVAAGNGGDGGDDNIAAGGDVELTLVHSVETVDLTSLEDVLNGAEDFEIEDFLSI
jgi:hypothetical protein